MLKRFRLVIFLAILFLIEFSIVTSLETTRLNNVLTSDSGLKILRAESLGLQDGHLRLRVSFENESSQTASYPYLRGEADGNSIYLSYDESLQPSDFVSVAEIPPKTEASGVYVLDGSSSEQVKGKTIVLFMDTSDGETAEYEVSLQ